ncbi:hypothetical protein JCM18899A_14140 [Nocardioides sp. AN3]
MTSDERKPAVAQGLSFLFDNEPTWSDLVWYADQVKASGVDLSGPILFDYDDQHDEFGRTGMTFYTHPDTAVVDPWATVPPDPWAVPADTTVPTDPWGIPADSTPPPVWTPESPEKKAEREHALQEARERLDPEIRRLASDQGYEVDVEWVSGMADVIFLDPSKYHASTEFRKSVRAALAGSGWSAAFNMQRTHIPGLGEPAT